MLYLIGIGLGNEKDISLNGLDAVKKADKIYLDNYTSELNCSIKDLEKIYGKKIGLADRKFVEDGRQILKYAKKGNVALLIIGDVFSATTHIDLFLRAKKENIKVKVIHGSSIISAVGVTGLQLYNFGKIASIPFNNVNIKAPVEIFKVNKKNGMHTLFLLDLDQDRFLTIKEACEYLINNGVNEKTKAIGCAMIGSEKQIIKYSNLTRLKEIDFWDAPYCLIIPGKLHFMEEEALDLWK